MVFVSSRFTLGSARRKIDLFELNQTIDWFRQGVFDVIKEIVKKFYLSILGFIVITHFPSLEKWKDKSNEVKT